MCAAGRIIQRGPRNSCALCVIVIARTKFSLAVISNGAASHRHFERSASGVRNPLAGCSFQGDLSLSLEMTGAEQLSLLVISNGADSYRHFEQSASGVRNPLAGCSFQGDLSLSLEMTGAGTMPPSSLGMTGAGAMPLPLAAAQYVRAPCRLCGRALPVFCVLAAVPPVRKSGISYQTEPRAKPHSPVRPSLRQNNIPTRTADRASPCPTERRAERRHSTTSSVPSIYLIS